MNTNTRFGLHSTRNKIFRFCMGISSVYILMLSFFTLFPYYEDIERAKAEGAPNAVQSTINLDVASNTAELNFSWTGGISGTFASSGDAITFDASTNNASGYTLKYIGSNDTGTLTHEDGDFSFSSISSPLTLSDFSATANSTYNNQWGFKPSKYVSGNSVINNTGAAGAFLPVPTTTGVIIDKTNAPNINEENYTIEIGARADMNIVAGEYTGSYDLLITANPVSYRITYVAGNTTDEIQNLPETQNSSTSDTSITLSSETPTRAHHSFLGWCDVLPTTTNGADSCTGTNEVTGSPATQYAVGSDFGINQTTQNNTTLYAMWQIDTYTCTKQYRLENADGSWSDYIADEEETINYGGSCVYNKSLTDYKGIPTGPNNTQASTTINNVTKNVTAPLNLYRNTYTLTVTAGTNTSSATGSGSYRWGQTTAIGVTKAANVTCTTYSTPTWIADIGTAPATGVSSTYIMPKSNATVSASSASSNVAQTITFKTVNATSITLNGAVKANNQTMSINCGTYNLSGAIPANYHFTSWGATAGTLGSASALSTTYQVTSNATITLNAAINSYNQTTRYRYENADGTWGGWTTAETVSKNYGSSYSWSTSQISNFNSTAYQAASVASYTVTGAKTNDVNIYRKTFTCFIQSRDQGTDGSYGSYTTRVNSTVRYGSTCSWSVNATTSHQAASYSNTNVTANVSQSVNVNRKTFTCSRQYRLQNADGTWGNYSADGSVTAYYGGSCAYAKAVTDYKNSASGTNGAQASTSATNVTANQTLSLSFYRNTYTLTVTAGTNTSSATGGGTKRWGEATTVGVTKANNVTCTTYGTPTWTQSGTAGAFSATSGASVAFTMGKGNATVTATSAASNVAQTIMLSRSGGAASIVIAGTGYTGTSVSLNCGTYNISGTYSTNYEFSSWAGANGVAVANTAAASTTMTVTGAGTLTLNGKSSKIYMQDVTTANCPTTRTLVYDSRDEQAYYIQKLTYSIGGGSTTTKCWMTSNLNLAAGAVIEPTKSNISGRTYTLPSNSLKTFAQDNYADVYNSGNSSSGSACSAADGCYSYYDINAAMVGGATKWSEDGHDYAADICPKGWRIPSRGEYINLSSGYGVQLLNSPWYGVLGGRLTFGSFGNKNTEADYWTSTTYNSTATSTYYFGIRSSSIITDSSASNSVGFSVRCVAY